MGLSELASRNEAGELLPGLIVLFVAAITVPVNIGLGLVELRARHG